MTRRKWAYQECLYTFDSSNQTAIHRMTEVTWVLAYFLKIVRFAVRHRQGEKNQSLGNCGKVHVIPQSEKEIIGILQYANKDSKSINIEGGGTKRCFGGLKESADILLSLSRYKGIVEHVVGDMTVTVKSGTTFKELTL